MTPDGQAKLERHHQFRAEERQQKADFVSKGIAGLLTINGGGAVALGSLLAAVIDKPRAAELLPFIAQGIIWTTGGVVAAASIFIAQYAQVVQQQRQQRFRHRNVGWWAAWALTVLSLFCFARGMWLLAMDAARFMR